MVIGENVEFQKEIGRLKFEIKSLNRTIADLKKEKAILTETVSRAGYRIAELKHEIDELKAHCKVVDDVNAKMKCCGNCKKIFICRKADISGMGSFPYNCKDWELAE